MKLRILPAAIADLAAIRLFIAADSPRAADRIAARLRQACRSLPALPARGRPGLLPGTREITTVWPYVIVYRVTASSVEVLRIWHGAQERR